MTTEKIDIAADEPEIAEEPVGNDEPITEEEEIADENKKDISYKIVIPLDSTVTAEEVLTNKKLKTRTGGFCGRKIIFYLVAVWGEETTYLGNTEWSSNIFTCEITNIEYEDRPSHISTSEIAAPVICGESLVRDNMAAVPLSVQLPHRPATSALLSIWKDDFSILVTSTKIDVSLPINYLTTFNIEHDTVQIGIDFAGSSIDVNNFDLHFVPRSYVSLAEYEEAFALQKIGDGSTYVLSFASNNSIKLLKGMFIGLSVIWGHSRMMSNFEIELPLPPSSLGLLWNVPKLTRLKQATLSCEVTNICDVIVNAQLELGNSPMIPLVKSVEIKKLKPHEKRVVSVPCVPTLVGNHELLYKVKVGTHWFKPLFKTIVHIE